MVEHWQSAVKSRVRKQLKPLTCNEPRASNSPSRIADRYLQLPIDVELVLSFPSKKGYRSESTGSEYGLVWSFPSCNEIVSPAISLAPRLRVK